jgi:hypothetical protein
MISTRTGSAARQPVTHTTDQKKPAARRPSAELPLRLSIPIAVRRGDQYHVLMPTPPIRMPTERP